MKSRWPDILCGAGVCLIGGACYAIHPALCAAFVGVVCLAVGVKLFRVREKTAKGPQ